MRLGLGLSQEQTQKLLMTPELRMAIKILQLSTTELVQYVEEQLVENPVLEAAEETGEAEQDTGPEKETEDDEESFDPDWEQYFEDISDAGKEKPVNRDREDGRYDQLIAEVPTLQDHLLFQLVLARLNKEERTVGEFLIGNIDENGYLQSSSDEAAIQGNVPFTAAEKVLKIIQGFDPPGVGARDLRECLLIQYEQMNWPDGLLKEIINNYLPEVAAGKAQKVAKKLGVSLPEVQAALDHLKLLEPKPGRKFSRSDDTRYIIPDVVVEKVNNDYIVLVNDTSAPRLTISNIYKEMLRGGMTDREGRKFLEAKLNSAAWLIRSIEQRRITLYRVTKCIVDFQREFFDRGVKFLRPMNLKQVAGALGLHESTVSRATANKYLQTPRGVFEMKFFFPGGIATLNGSATSAEVVKRMIRELINNEEAKKPFSDQRITELLQAEGVDLSRRTVAKYREEMGIPPASKRRRY